MQEQNNKDTPSVLDVAPMQTAHQKLIRDHNATEPYRGLFAPPWESIDHDISKAIVRPVSYATAKTIIEKYEWLGSMAQRTTHCFGIYFDGLMGGAACFSLPPTPQAAEGPCGADYSHLIKTLSRGACVHWAHPHSASKLIGQSIAWMIANTSFRVFIAYADPRAGEIGTVYQATNWLYTGTTNGDIEYLIDGQWKSGRTARHKSYQRRGIDYRVMPQRRGVEKHRYVFIGGSRKEQRVLMKALRYDILPYPKRTYCVEEIE